MKLPLVRQSITRKTKPIAKYIVTYRTTLEAKYIQLLRIEKEYLNSMPCMTHNYHLKFPLHLPDSELPGSQKTIKEIISHTVAAFPSLRGKNKISDNQDKTAYPQTSCLLYSETRGIYLSNLSVPARSRSFGTGQDRNTSDKPSYLGRTYRQVSATNK